MAENLLSVKDLVIKAKVHHVGEKPFDVTLVDKVSFTLEKGKVLGLIGESGAGKSTIGLATLVYGRFGCTITDGEVILNNENVLDYQGSKLREHRGGRVAYVAQWRWYLLIRPTV